MKIIYVLGICLLVSCADKNQNTYSPKKSWSLEEPQIINNKGKIFLTSVQHQNKSSLNLTDSLLFNSKDKDLTFHVLTRCYDSDQKEFVEKKSFEFSNKISIQKLMPKQSFHPKYLLNDNGLNCTFKFSVQKSDGSTHNFRLYSQNIDLKDQIQNSFIEVLSLKKADNKMILAENFHKELFMLPEQKISKLELVCQSFISEYLAQKSRLNSFYGFDIQKQNRPVELCRIIASTPSNYLLSKPFQVKFKDYGSPLKVYVLPNKYSKASTSFPVMKIEFSNSYDFPLNYQIHWPDKINIIKMGTAYQKAFSIQFQNTKSIKKIHSQLYQLHLKPKQKLSFIIYTDLSKVCYNKPTGFLQWVFQDPSSDVYFSPSDINLLVSTSKDFNFKSKIKIHNYISVEVNRGDQKWDLVPEMNNRPNKVNINFKPYNNDGCLLTRPK